MNKSLLLASALLIVGCGTPASYKDPNGRDLVVSLEKVNIQDFATAGSAMLQSMVQSKAFDRKDAPVLQLGQILNDTTTNFDTSLLLSKITMPLVNAGRIQLIESDPVAAAARKASGATAAVPVAEFVLKGKILEDRANAGGIRQSSYIFQLTLVDVRTSLAVWAKEETVTKAGSKNSVGF
jgi:PBP1b-binding outer membrane lipoprotein LpoB